MTYNRSIDANSFSQNKDKSVLSTQIFNRFLWSGLIAGLLSAGLMGCGKAESATVADQAQSVRVAINADDPTKLMALISIPLSVREQQWESASDGSGFVLTSVEDKKISSEAGLKDIVDEIQIEEDALHDDDDLLNLFAMELMGVEADWKSLLTVFFVRGVGDVEHIVLLGFDPDTLKLQALYFN